jgi:hypothetical protein
MERRLAAILIGDMVGYSRLMSTDEAGILTALKTSGKNVLRPLVAKPRGRIVKLMGDGAMVEFASAVDVVECAIAVQVAMHPGYHHRPFAGLCAIRRCPQHRIHFQTQGHRDHADRPQAECALPARRQRSEGREPSAHYRATDRRRDWRAPLGRALRPRVRGCPRATGLLYLEPTPGNRESSWRRTPTSLRLRTWARHYECALLI